MVVSKTPFNKGMRERKRRETKERIADAAMKLFLKYGFEGTKIDEIAAVADVSRRSFFDYFPTKEAVIFSWQDDFTVNLVKEVEGRPDNEPIVVAVESALATAIVTMSSPQSMAIERLVRTTSALSQWNHHKFLKLEQVLSEAITRREGTEAIFKHRLLAMVMIGAVRLASDEGLAKPAIDDLEAYIRDRFAAVWCVMGDFSRESMGAEGKQTRTGCKPRR